MNRKGVMVEEWKARRKEWKKKEEEKREKGKKWFWQKSFLFSFDCGFSLALTHHHTTTYALT